ncbi:16S rRNA (guanine(527)-N(7))-methyltransferase RsmG [Ancylobacter dichloromethanicus]|uniref:Ribosomal RNA small subunit methyltransferase G n=1 Tax=Ancylobacter dichloromethanicus TaxID=518825 RepID=A0A9W6J9D5_9HYPH|nr:16S rRNA (guanine(527)-N(7))-methyltransferase RsmG [Ancylobacter dichloromethanicus]MBS7554927.1 16S rRNA (guanine(527)-N(7))-methyltransferase RsmG [Ancylobacter dichloromethanicus]GLK73321.1 ribosomal RNA small subunit methyltransferase G [Ancylobacter dichloromethanicus]
MSHADSPDRVRALSLTPVSRETEGRLDIIVALLEKWQRTINLVAPATLPQVWTRHVADSLQLLPLAGAARRWVDLGSGGGFPGLVVAAALAERGDADVTLVESDSRKAAFLREAARLADLPVTVLPARIEQVSGAIAAGVEVVSARALAPLPRLLELAVPFLAAGATGLFLKGQDVDNELTQASKSWRIDAEIKASLTDGGGHVLIVRAAERLGAASSGGREFSQGGHHDG